MKQHHSQLEGDTKDLMGPADDRCGGGSAWNGEGYALALLGCPVVDVGRLGDIRVPRTHHVGVMSELERE